MGAQEEMGQVNVAEGRKVNSSDEKKEKGAEGEIPSEFTVLLSLHPPPLETGESAY